MSSVSRVPRGYHTITPHVVVSDAKKAAEFYKQAFGAEILGLHYTPEGKVMHAEARIGDSRLMFVDEFPDLNCLSPTSTKADPCVVLHLYVDDVDAIFAAAIQAGATTVMEPKDQFWGDRYGQVLDPFGHRWSIASRITNPSIEELEAEQNEAMAKASANS